MELAKLKEWKVIISITMSILISSLTKTLLFLMKRFGPGYLLDMEANKF